MHARYAFDVDPARRLVRITLSGFYTAADVDRFDAARPAIYDPLAASSGDYVTLCDVTGMKIQPQEVVGAFQRVAADSRYPSRKLAFVTGSSLARMQARRITERDGVAYFTDRAAAEAWLLA